MGQPAATQNSQVVGVDVHIVMVPSPGGPIPTPLPHPFSGMIQSGTAPTVKVGGQPVATHVDPSQPLEFAVLPRHRFRKRAVNIQSDDAHNPLPAS